MNKWRATALVAALVVLIGGVWAQDKAPLALKQTIPVSGLAKEGDFDHLAVDVQGNRLFLMGEDNSVVEIFDLGAGKQIHHAERSGHHSSRSQRKVKIVSEIERCNIVDGQLHSETTSVNQEQRPDARIAGGFPESAAPAWLTELASRSQV